MPCCGAPKLESESESCPSVTLCVSSSDSGQVAMEMRALLIQCPSRGMVCLKGKGVLVPPQILVHTHAHTHTHAHAHVCAHTHKRHTRLVDVL